MEFLTAVLSSAPPSPPPALPGVRVLPPKSLNTSVYLDLNRFSRHTAWAHGFMHHYALWLGPVLLAVVFVAAYVVSWWRRAPRAAALLLLGGIGTVVALGLNQIVGHAAKELRPYAAHPNVLVLVAKANDYSFPSDHSIVAGGLTVSVLVALAGGAWKGRRPAGDALREGAAAPGILKALAAANVVLGVFLCFARVYVGAHYPGDVVAGYLLAGVVVLAAFLLRPLVFRAVGAIEATGAGSLLRRPGAVPADV
ncbi:phosphatase PAP2 family protein [Acidiferrimicrobium sp. IK]|uniref:phosphatase PAP2 family protein n=1 Tax=Acidiferrimicrobium sp. IK TaxID=2871700 RepID=UPI0021CB2B3A|nr:phosphatase PAP2 family protein [Acidiferrimicrobium sp. IK]MCU4184978.1 phosphatase PAP2 family protein [Acidiferrimicrobium sp. IK]